MFLKDVASKIQFRGIPQTRFRMISLAKSWISYRNRVFFDMCLKDVFSNTLDPQAILKYVFSKKFIFDPKLFLKAGGLEDPFPI